MSEFSSALENLGDVTGFMDDFEVVTGLRPLLIDRSGTIKIGKQKGRSFCNLVARSPLGESQCVEIRKAESEIAYGMKEPYVFRCHMGLAAAMVPVYSDGDALGNLLLGPVAFRNIDDTFLKEILAEGNELGLSDKNLRDALEGLRIIPATRFKAISSLLFRTVNQHNGNAALVVSETRPSYKNGGAATEKKRKRSSARQIGHAEAKFDVEQAAEAVFAHLMISDFRLAKRSFRERFTNALVSFDSDIDRARASFLRLATALAHHAVLKGVPSSEAFEIGPLKKAVMRANDMDSLNEAGVEFCRSLREALKKSKATNGAKGPLAKALAYIDKQYAKDISLVSVAGWAKVTPQRLGRLIKEELGRTFNQHLSQTRVEAAKKLLSGGRASATVIAAKVGFADQSYFSKIFKQHTGLTPGAYRKRIRANVKR